MDNDLIEIRKFFKERIARWMIGDLKLSIGANTNFLTALGCFVYTEVIGTFLPDLPQERGLSIKQKRFYRCFFRLGSADYLRFLDKWLLDNTSRNIYESLRNSMAHVYYPLVVRNRSGVREILATVVAKEGLGKQSGMGTLPLRHPFFSMIKDDLR